MQAWIIIPLFSRVTRFLNHKCKTTFNIMNKLLTRFLSISIYSFHLLIFQDRDRFNCGNFYWNSWLIQATQVVLHGKGLMESSSWPIRMKLPEDGEKEKANQIWIMINWVELFGIITTKILWLKFMVKDTHTNLTSRLVQKLLWFHTYKFIIGFGTSNATSSHGSSCIQSCVPIGRFVHAPTAVNDHRWRISPSWSN